MVAQGPRRMMGGTAGDWRCLDAVERCGVSFHGSCRDTIGSDDGKRVGTRRGRYRSLASACEGRISFVWEGFRSRKVGDRKWRPPWMDFFRCTGGNSQRQTGY